MIIIFVTTIPRIIWLFQHERQKCSLLLLHIINQWQRRVFHEGFLCPAVVCFVFHFLRLFLLDLSIHNNSRMPVDSLFRKGTKFQLPMLFDHKHKKCLSTKVSISIRFFLSYLHCSCSYVKEALFSSGGEIQTQKFNIYKRRFFFFPLDNWINELISEETKVPRTLFEAINVAGSAKYKLSHNTVLL